MSETSTPHAARPRAVAPGQLAWLEREITEWRAAGVLDDRQATEIRGRYAAVRRFSLAKLLVYLGGSFLGVGLLWLVATNLADVSPLLRFVVVTSLWLGLAAATEGLAARRANRNADGEAGASPIVGAFRLVTAMGYGAVVFQAAQSLQVPAFEPTLVGVWGLGALLYAYAVGGITPLLVGITATTVWYVWEVLVATRDGMGFVLPTLLAAVLAGAVAVVHAGRWRPAFAATWREASALLALLALFVAAFPQVRVDGFDWSWKVILGVLAALTAAAVSIALTAGRARFEAMAPVLALGAGILLVMWEPALPIDGVVTGEGYTHAVISVAVYVVAAGWYATLGVWRDSARLTFVATAALVLFTTTQSFAVFAPIVTGATLFLVLGVIFLGSGFVFERGRRHLVANLQGASA